MKTKKSRRLAESRPVCVGLNRGAETEYLVVLSTAKNLGTAKKSRHGCRVCTVYTVRICGAVWQAKLDKSVSRIVSDRLIVENSKRYSARYSASIVENGQAIVENGQAIVENGQAIVENGQAIVENGQAIVENGQAIVKNSKR